MQNNPNIYYGVKTEINNADDTATAEMVYSPPDQKVKPENTHDDNWYGSTLIINWYESRELAKKALIMRKKSLQKLAKIA